MSEKNESEEQTKEIIVGFLKENYPMNPCWTLTAIDELTAKQLKVLLSQAVFVSLNKHGKDMCKEFGDHVMSVVTEIGAGAGIKNTANPFQILYQRKHGINERNGAIWSLALNRLVAQMTILEDTDIKDDIAVIHKGTETIPLTPSCVDENNDITNLVILDSHNEELFLRLMIEGGIKTYEPTNTGIRKECSDKQTCVRTYKISLNKKGMLFMNMQKGNLKIRTLSSELSDSDYIDIPKEV